MTKFENTSAFSRRSVLRAAIFAHLTCLLGEDNFTSANIRIFAHVPPRVRDATMTCPISSRLLNRPMPRITARI